LADFISATSSTVAAEDTERNKIQSEITQKAKTNTRGIFIVNFPP